MPGTVRLAEPAELATWDARVVDAPGGDVYQSVAWAEHRARRGWRPRFLLVGDAPVLALVRPWPLVPGGSAYVSRGPIPTVDPATLAGRLAAVADWLAATGVDVVAADPEVPAGSGFGDRLVDLGFHRIEEIQPSRHRLDLPLGPGADEASVLAGFSATTRNLVRQAERQGLRVVRLDQRVATAPGFAPDLAHGLAPGFAPGPPTGPAQLEALRRLYGILADTAERRAFRLAPWAVFADWTAAALGAGHVVALVVEREDGEAIAGATFYRHGERLTYAVSGERADMRRTHPGAARLLLWRAIQIALAEGRGVMDMGGVDVAGARREPRPDEPSYGLYQFKQSFGARWVELTGAHERTIRPARYALGRVLARLRGRR